MLEFYFILCGVMWSTDASGFAFVSPGDSSDTNCIAKSRSSVTPALDVWFCFEHVFLKKLCCRL